MANAERDNGKIGPTKQQDREGPLLKFSPWLTMTNESW